MKTGWLVGGWVLFLLVFGLCFEVAQSRAEEAAPPAAEDEPAAAAAEAPKVEAPAAAPAEPPPPVTRRRTLWSKIQAMGTAFIIVFLIVSFISVAFIVEHFISIQRDKVIPPVALAEVEDLFEREEFEQALEVCESEESLATGVIAAGLSRMNSGYEEMVESMETVEEEETTNLHQKISYLALIATIAPMLGLLGTVVGMIGAFEKVGGAAAAGGVNPELLAQDISKALMTTCVGLIIAIPVMSFYHYFRNRVVKLVLEARNTAFQLMSRFRPTS